MDKYINTNKEQFKAFLKLPVNQPLQMLNLLKFKKEVNETGVSGEEQYKVYMKAAAPFFQKSNAKVLFYGETQHNIIGPANDLEWDKVLIVEYTNKEDFVNMITNPEYPSDLRTIALEDSRLIFCTSKI